MITTYEIFEVWSYLKYVLESPYFLWFIELYILHGESRQSARQERSWEKEYVNEYKTMQFVVPKKIGNEDNGDGSEEIDG